MPHLLVSLQTTTAIRLFLLTFQEPCLAMDHHGSWWAVMRLLYPNGFWSSFFRGWGSQHEWKLIHSAGCWSLEHFEEITQKSLGTTTQRQLDWKMDGSNPAGHNNDINSDTSKCSWYGQRDWNDRTTNQPTDRPTDWLTDRLTGTQLTNYFSMMRRIFASHMLLASCCHVPACPPCSRYNTNTIQFLTITPLPTVARGEYKVKFALYFVLRNS